MTRSSSDAAGAHPLPSTEERRRPREAKSLSEEQVATPTEPGITPELPDTSGASVTDNSSAARAAPEALSATGALSAPEAPAEAFDALYNSCAVALFRQTLLLTGRRNLSQESVARAFARAWERWPEVAVDRDPAGWVRAAAHEYALSPWHRLRRRHRHPGPPPAEPGARALLDALLGLPPMHRRTLLLYDGVGLDLPETAAETEASTPAAANRLMNARAAVAERLPELAEPSSPTAQSALLHQQLAAIAQAQPPASLPSPDVIRTDSERKARLWTRAAVSLTVLLIGLTLFALTTAPARYETPEAPPRQVVGVPPRGGPQQLTPQDLELRKKLRGELVQGPARLVLEPG
ncbi:RNA polymerase sigma factor [Streptomyces sp. NPDC018000]|uniref:RNA polymerase sigma factor n=1 Tax=Streptomyces sp. NPDC018000 TaxID=3365028 RepID=UPI0037980B81